MRKNARHVRFWRLQLLACLFYVSPGRFSTECSGWLLHMLEAGSFSSAVSSFAFCWVVFSACLQRSERHAASDGCGCCNLSWRALEPPPPPQCAYPGVTTMKGLTPSHDKTKHGTWRCADNMQFLEGLARSVHSHSAQQPRATRACQGSSRAGCTATDASASCALPWRHLQTRGPERLLTPLLNLSENLRRTLVFAHRSFTVRCTRCRHLSLPCREE